MKIAAALFTTLLALGCSEDGRQSAPAIRASPDLQYSVQIRDYLVDMDRRFDIILQTNNNSGKSVIYSSPDEGAPSERIVWATNSRYFLVTGKHLSVLTNAQLTFASASHVANEYGYLLYDVASNALYCNSAQDSRCPRFTLSDLVEKGFSSADIPGITNKQVLRP